MFDSHIHLNDIDHDTAISMLSDSERSFISCAYDISSGKATIALAEEWPNVYGALGVHPSYINSDETAYLDDLADLISSHGSIIAVGETGLDSRAKDKDLQEKIFIRQLDIASELSVPVIIHNVGSTGRIFEIIKDFKQLRYIFHGYSGSKEVTRELLSFDSYFGIGRTVTYDGAKKIKGSLEIIPDERLLAETDDPFMNREDIINNLEKVLAAMAEIKKISVDEAVTLTEMNTRKAFGIGYGSSED